MPVIAGNYRLSIEETNIDGIEAFKIKAEPINPVGYMFYAYRTKDEAMDVIDNLAEETFDDMIYRVNFAPDNGQYLKKD